MLCLQSLTRACWMIRNTRFSVSTVFCRRLSRNRIVFSIFFRTQSWIYLFLYHYEIAPFYIIVIYAGPQVPDISHQL